MRTVLAFTFIFVGIFLSYLQLVNGRKFIQLSDNNRIRIVPQLGSRGNILDRKGSVIIGNRLSYNVLVIPRQIYNSDNTIRKLSEILEVPFEKLQSTFRQRQVSSFLPVVLVENIDKKKAIIIEEARPSLPGVIIDPVPTRFYPYQKLACHLAGYLGEIDHWRLTKLKDYGYNKKDIVGYSGIEERYDYYLRQEEGGLQVEVDHLGNITRILGLRSPKNGKDIQLTVDLEIQKIIEESLGEREGAVVIMDSYSGEILGMASSPGFNPEIFINKSASKESIFKNPHAPLFNRCISGAYPLGSVFKVVVAAAALESKKISPSTTYQCSGSLMIGRRSYSCWSAHGDENLKNALIHSCNVFFYRLGLLLGPDRMYEWALKFGLGKPTQIDLPSENSGHLPNSFWERLNKFKTWFDGDTANFAIGQGDLLVSPIQTAVFMASIANGGNLVRPYLIKSIGSKDVVNYQRRLSHVPIRDTTLELIRAGLRGVVGDEEGTANILSGVGVSVSGKTGTAQTTSGRQPHAWFVGFFPAEKPKFTICVFLEHAGPSVYACQIAKRIIEAMKEKGLL